MDDPLGARTVAVPTDTKSAFDIHERLAKASERLEKLASGALVAFTAGAVVVGVVGGGVLWIPAAMAGALSAYRGARFFLLERRDRHRDQWWKEYMRVGQAKQALAQAGLPQEEFEKLNAPLDQKLALLRGSAFNEEPLLLPRTRSDRDA